MKELFCQSCAMPLQNPEDFGTNQDGSQNQEYCSYCYQKGAFEADCTMEEMIEFCLDATKDMGIYDDRGEAKQQMMGYFPTLTRWRKS